MKKRCLLLLTKRVYWLTLLGLASLSSCQRAPYAYMAPTPHPAHQRVAGNSAATLPPTDERASASLTNSPSFSTRPVWETSLSAATTGVAQEAKPTAVRQPLRRRSAKSSLTNRSATAQCDQIVLRNGDVVEAKVKEVGVNEIRYKKCDRQDGPDYTISKRDVLSIKYSNGEVERFNTAGTNSGSSTNSSTGSRPSYNSPTNSSDDGLHTDPFAIVAIVTGGLAILTGYGAFLLGAAAIVFGALSLSRIRKEPGRFKGRGLAIGGMIAGIVAAGVILLYTLL